MRKCFPLNITLGRQVPSSNWFRKKNFLEFQHANILEKIRNTDIRKVFNQALAKLQDDYH